MNENDGGGVCCSLSLLPFFPLFPLANRVEPHIGSVISVDIFEYCSNPLLQIRFFSIEILQIFRRFRSQMKEKTFFYRMRSICSKVIRSNMEKFEK